MDIFLTNTISRKKERFQPIDSSHVKMYACGPTVYDRAHIGNARAAVVYDVLYRLLREVFPKVTYVRNITDVDDKIIAACGTKGIDASTLTGEMISHYSADMNMIGCIAPTFEPKATEHIDGMIEMIMRLVGAGHAYCASGHVLFSVGSFSDYGLLSGRSREEMIAGARVEVAPFKKDPADFVLWKPVVPGEEAFCFESPWGLGRPGWHIECSAMSKEYLGEEFDIHGGGADLMFPHHENEVAQSICSSRCGRFIRYWVHNGFLMVDGQKMSKSLGNFKTVHDVATTMLEGCALRYLYLGTHYRKPLDFTERAFYDAVKSVQKFSTILHRYPDIPGQIEEEFLNYLADDMNTSEYISRMHYYASAGYAGSIEAVAKLRGASDMIGLTVQEQEVVPEYVVNLVLRRQEARMGKNWILADAIRAEIEELGYEVHDGAESKVRKKFAL